VGPQFCVLKEARFQGPAPWAPILREEKNNNTVSSTATGNSQQREDGVRGRH
jgi:hypothetical protein